MVDVSAPAPPPRLSDEVAQALGGAIARRDYQPGARLPTERALALHFGVSRIVVREALARLKTDGLIETRQGAGAFVAKDSTKTPFRISAGAEGDLRPLYELRLAVEGAAAGMASENATPDDIRAMQEALNLMAQDIEHGRSGVEADEAFHSAIARASHNPYVAQFIAFLGVQMRAAISTARANTASTLPQAVMSVQAEHERIFAAIGAKDRKGAEAAMQEHLRNAMNRLFPEKQ